MKYFIYPVLLGLGLAGCSQSAKQEMSQPTSETAAIKPPTPTPPTDPATPAVAYHAPTAPAEQNTIYEGTLDLAVDDFKQASTGIHGLLEEYHAHLGTTHETRAHGEHREEMTVKVPPAQFLHLVEAVGKLGRIENKEVSSADVTADMLEASASLSAKQTSEAKYQQLLATTTNPAEIRRLEEQARQLRLEVAAAQSRLQQFGARSSWATLTLRYFQVLPTPAPALPLPDFAPRFMEAFYRGLFFVLGLVVVLTNLWPLLLLGGAGAWGVRRWRLRHPVAA